MEMEVVGIRKKGEKADAFFKFKDSSVLLYNILDFQIYPYDETCLGYKKKGEKYEDDTWSLRTPEAGPSTSKDAPRAPIHMTTRTLEVKKCNKELGMFLQASLENKQLQDGTKVPGMKVDLMVIVIFAPTLVIKQWIADSTKEVVEVSMTKLNVGHVIKLDMLLPHVTH